MGAGSTRFFTKQTVTTRTDFVKNQRMVGHFALFMLWIAVLYSVFTGG